MEAGVQRAAVHGPPRSRAALASVRAWLVTPPAGAALLVLGFIGLSVRWLAVDQRVPDFDNGKHLNIVFTYHDRFTSGDVFGIFSNQPYAPLHLYPPLIHYIGMLGTLIGGVNVQAPIMAQNLVLVPLLALGCYGAATVAFDRLAGMLAVGFALASPMIISQFHVFMLDPGEAAFVALSVWLLLASRRFERTGFSIAAGAAVGLGALTKQTFVLFVAGLVVAIVARGGWRQWRNLALFAGVALAIALPWHLAHLSDFSKQVDEAASANNAYPKPDWDLERFTWYGWNVMNLQLWLPLTVLFVAGLVAAVARFARTRRSDDPTPELVAGGIASFLGVAVAFHFHNPRYTLPALVYLAVLGTGWVAFAGRRLRLAAVAAVVGLFAVNNVGVDFAPWDPVVIGNRGPLVVEHSATVVSNFGLVVGPPKRSGRVLEILKAAHRDGVREVEFSPTSVGELRFNVDGLNAFARIAHLRVAPLESLALAPPDRVYLIRRDPSPGLPRPCTTTAEGWFIYMIRGPTRKPLGADNAYCPLRS